MTERDQLRQACHWNRQLAAENADLRRALQQAREEVRDLQTANAGLQAEAVATDVLLGAAMDAALGDRQR